MFHIVKCNKNIPVPLKQTISSIHKFVVAFFPKNTSFFLEKIPWTEQLQTVSPRHTTSFLKFQCISQLSVFQVFSSFLPFCSKNNNNNTKICCLKKIPRRKRAEQHLNSHRPERQREQNRIFPMPDCNPEQNLILPFLFIFLFSGVTDNSTGSSTANMFVGGCWIFRPVLNPSV